MPPVSDPNSVALSLCVAAGVGFNDPANHPVRRVRPNRTSEGVRPHPGGTAGPADGYAVAQIPEQAPVQVHSGDVVGVTCQVERSMSVRRFALNMRSIVRASVSGRDRLPDESARRLDTATLSARRLSVGPRWLVFFVECHRQ